MADLSRKPSGTLPSFGDHTHQPSKFKFPLSREFGQKTIVNRAFSSAWFNWLHYDKSQDIMFCFPCLKAFKEKKLTGGNPDKAFISMGLPTVRMHV